MIQSYSHNYTPEQRSCWGVYCFHSVRPSICPSIHLSVRLSHLPCPLCNIYSSGWILYILATIDLYHERVCRTQGPLTLTYIFKVIRPWLRKLCPLCSIYSSGWILFIPHASTKLKRGYTGFTLSVCPSVDRIVSALYLQQYSSDPFHICTSYQATSEGVLHAMFQNAIQTFEILVNSLNVVTLTLSSFDLGSNMTQWYG